MKVIVFFAVCILLCNSAFAFSGVNPRSYEINFKPDYGENFNFNFVIDENSKVNLYVEGDLSDYVSLDKKKISGREKVVASLSLPSEIDSPGINQIRIIAGDVVGIIKINVPYPDKYIELRLSAPNINVGETVSINLDVFSRGNDSVVVKPKIEIYKNDEKIETIEIESEEISGRNSRRFNISLNASGYSAGDYLVIATANSDGKTARTENPFRIGEPLVRILNYTKEFRENKIDKFEIEIESLWNSNMDDLYAEVNVIGLENAGFITPVVGLKAWRTTTLAGFLDSAEIPDYEFKAKIILHHGNKTSSHIVKLKILKGFDYVFYSVIIGCLMVLGLLIWRGKIFVRKYRKYRKLLVPIPKLLV